MIKKRISVLALLALSGSILGLFALSGTAISQDYVAPDQAQEEAGKPEEKSTSPAAPALETEYEKRLREEIDRQLKAQQAGEADTGDTAEDDENWEDEEEDTAAEEDTDIPTANCSTLASAVKSIVEIAADGKPEDKSLKAKLGQKLNSLIRGASAGFNQLPNKMECSLGGGTAVKNIDDDVKKEFDKQFRTDCKRLAREARAAVKAGDLKAYADYMEGQISELSQTSINDAVVKKCNSGDTVVADTQPGGTSGVGGTGSGGSGGGGQQNYDQSYPQNYEPPGHQHSLSGSPGGANERPFQSSLPPIPESHNDDPPGMTFPPGARRLKMRFDGRQYGQDDRYANCVFHDGTSPVLDCKKKLDWVLRDVLGRNKGLVASMDMGMYHGIYDVCKKLNNPACEDGGNSYAIVASAYRGPGTQEIVNPGVSAASSCHPKAKSTDLNFPGASAAKVNAACDQLDKSGSNTVLGCGKYSGFTEINSCNKSWTKYGNPKA